MKYDAERAVFCISVGELVAYGTMGGDLDLRPGMGKRFLAERAAIGSAVHRKLQSEAGVLYTPEVSLCHTVLLDGITFEISGRADGIIATQPLTVDEIKTVSARAFDHPPSLRHSDQLNCYAYMLATERGLSEIRTRLTYYRVENGAIKHVEMLFQREVLKEQFYGLLSRLVYRAKLLIHRQSVLLPGVRSGKFPFSSLREGQDILLKECYRDIKAGKRLFAEAPTGIGKTVSTLYPAVRALGEGHCDKIFYLTAKAAARREAYAAAAKIFKAGAHLRTVVLTAREQICKNEMAKCSPVGVSRHCNPLDCPYAKGFYDRAPLAICELMEKQSGYPRRTLEETAEKYSICPYELQLELSELCDIIICDYNYVFDPQVYLRRYFSPQAQGESRYVFLIDEAHNLSDRARDMYSARLNSTAFSSLLSLLETEDPLRKRLKKTVGMMQGLRRLCKDTLQKDEEGVEHGYYLNHGAMEDLRTEIEAVGKEMEAWLRSHRTDPLETAVYLQASSVKRFSLIFEYFDQAFLTFVEVAGEECSVRLVCLDPSRVLDACMNRAHASVLFSATLTPPDYFADILGGGKQAVRISLPSPFAPENFGLIALTNISTRYGERAKSYKRILSAIAATVSAKRGNYIVYFPSYEYMEAVLELFAKRYPKVQTVVQKRGMSAQEKESFLGAFADDGRLRVGFCVLGGSFSEGVDLPGGQLIGSVIVGTGLPGITSERNILMEHYDTTRERGFDYAYVYPGMNRVLQAAGRVIRRDSDRGVVVLIDERYADPRTKAILPEHWNHIQYAGSANELAEMLLEFWKKF
ncbi:MAG: ATP-dependent DNA helicase [Clostridia bacterium]|nr:ATP-dependent DNA helicase [Clostridia bacterium]